MFFSIFRFLIPKLYFSFNWLTLASGGIYQPKQKSKQPNTYQFVPYSGRTPESPTYTKASEDAIYKRLLEQMQGINVGYAPERKSQSIDLLKSQIGKQAEDDVRAAQGMAAASGLGGNLRAQEALAGRVRRDSARSLSEGINQLNIEDLAAANQERLAGTQNLQRFNEFEFGQGNTAANFDLNKYRAEQGLQQSAAQDALAQYNYDQQVADQGREDLMNFGLNAAGLVLAPETGGASLALSQLASRQSGTGISPTSGIYDSSSSLKSSPLYRRRMLTR